MTSLSPRSIAQVAVASLLLGWPTASALGADKSTANSVVHPSRNADTYILSHDRSFFSTNASVRDIESLAKKVDGDFLWVRRAGKELIIRDPETIEAARLLFEPLNGLEPEREALQEKQEQLGRDEATLDDEEERLEDELEALEEQAEHHVSDSVRATLEHRQIDLNTKMRSIQVRERELDAEERVIDSRSDELERKAESAFWRLVDQAITNGLGRPVGRE